MFSILSISEIFVIAETLAFFGQLSIVCPLSLQLKYLPSFMSCDISASKFLGVGVIDPRSVLDRREKEVFLLGIVDAREENVTAFKETLAVVCTVVEDLAFSLIRSVACICS